MRLGYLCNGWYTGEEENEQKEHIYSCRRCGPWSAVCRRDIVGGATCRRSGICGGARTRFPAGGGSNPPRNAAGSRLHERKHHDRDSILPMRKMLWSVATDPDVIPMGTEVEIDGHIYIAQDVGGAISGNRIDLYFDSHEDALQWGVQEKIVRWSE